MTVLVFIACFSGRTSIVISCLFREQSKLLTRGAGYDLTKLEEWSDTWLLRFHPDKWKHMHIGQKNDDNSYSLHRKSLEKVIEEKDIGVVIDSDLTFEKHINEKVNKANQMFATLRSVTCRGLHVTGVIRFVPELLLWIQVTHCISCF